MGETRHISVLGSEVIELLRCHAGGEYLDCTLGGGGHAAAMLDANRSNRVCAVDRDERAIARARERFAGCLDRIDLRHAPFSQVGHAFAGRQFDGVLADLGLSTDQLWEDRGFSFRDSSLDMRMGSDAHRPASEMVNSLSEHELYVLMREGGVGPEAKGIAKAIVAKRPITSAAQLAELVTAATPPKKRGTSTVHPATVVFQAIRIAVNREFDELRALFEAVPVLAKEGGRFAVISFHSLEDKFVTGEMRRWEGRGEFSAADPTSWRQQRTSRGRLITRQAVVPSDREVAENPSSRSARLRVFEFSASTGQMR